jgi:membrane protein implicated in regulation of membrane protease activity
MDLARLFGLGALITSGMGLALWLAFADPPLAWPTLAAVVLVIVVVIVRMARNDNRPTRPPK